MTRLAPLRPVLGLVVATVLLGALGGAPRRRIDPPLHPSTPAGVFYIARQGETLAHIARHQGVPVEDLAEINAIAADAPLAEGQMVFVLAPERSGAVVAVEPPAATVTMPEVDDDVPEPVGAALAWPLDQVTVSSAFGKRWGRLHEGIDMAAPVGTPVRASAEGTVLYASDALAGYGKMVVLQHGGDLITAYAHNAMLLVRVGERVRRGQVIARVGQTGRASAPHLHFEVRRGKIPQNPYRFLPPLPK